jgi:hypothetical protein
LRRADEERQSRLERKAEEEAQMRAIARAATVSLAGPPRLVLVAVVKP